MNCTACNTEIDLTGYFAGQDAYTKEPTQFCSAVCAANWYTEYKEDEEEF